MVTGRKYSAKTRCFTAVILDPVTEIMSSLPRCNHQTISEIWSKCTMRRLARGATIHTAREGVNSTIIQCVHEQSLTGICIFHVFYLLP